MTFDAIASSDFFMENEDNEYNTAIQTLLNYVESTYVGRFDRRGKRQPAMFPIALWNCYDLTMEGLPQSNNSVEGWHNAFHTFIGHSHPNIYKFIESIRNEQNLQEMRMAQISASQDPEPRRKKYVKLDQRLKKIDENYDRDDIFGYLRAIAHNVIF